MGKSISAENRVSTYDQVTELINGSKGPFAILECFCRKMADMKGQPCKKTSRREVCLAIGDNARNSIANGNGRAISREEVLDITRMNEADGLVFETSNTQNIEVIARAADAAAGRLRPRRCCRSRLILLQATTRPGPMQRPAQAVGPAWKDAR